MVCHIRLGRLGLRIPIVVSALLVMGALLASACVPVQVEELDTPLVQPTSDENEGGSTEVIEVATDEAPDPAVLEFGYTIYREQYCGTCHELAVAGTTGQFGPSHNLVGVHASERLQDPQYTGSATSPEEYLYESLINPYAYFADGYVGASHRMPQYTHLSEEELQALVAFLMSQR